jgi:hypothetical protein
MYSLCPVSDNNEAGHVHTRDTIKVTEGEADSATVEIGGAVIFIEYGPRAHPFVPHSFELAKRAHAARMKEALKLK